MISFKNNQNNQNTIKKYDMNMNHFGNDWGLFVEIDIIDTNSSLESKYKYNKNTLEPILEENDIEKNLAEIACINNPNDIKQKKGFRKSLGCFSSLCLISLMTYIIFCVI